MKKEIIELKAFGHLSGARFQEPVDGKIKVPASFKGKDYTFTYEATGNVRKIRPQDAEEATTYVHEYELIEMKIGH